MKIWPISFYTTRIPRMIHSSVPICGLDKILLSDQSHGSVLTEQKEIKRQLHHYHFTVYFSFSLSLTARSMSFTGEHVLAKAKWKALALCELSWHVSVHRWARKHLLWFFILVAVRSMLRQSHVDRRCSRQAYLCPLAASQRRSSDCPWVVWRETAVWPLWE